MAALTTAGRQTLLSRLVTDIRAAATQAGIEVGDDLGELRAIAAALRHLVVARRAQRDRGTVAAGRGPADHRHLPARPARHRPGRRRAHARPSWSSSAGRPGPRGVEHTVRRRLVEDPVTHYADLTDEEASWLRRRARAEARLLERCFGLAAESRLEGIAVTDPEDYLTDVAFPGQSTVARIALLALPRAADAGARAAPRPPPSGSSRPAGSSSTPTRPRGRSRSWRACPGSPTRCCTLLVALGLARRRRRPLAAQPGRAPLAAGTRRHTTPARRAEPGSGGPRAGLVTVR